MLAARSLSAGSAQATHFGARDRDLKVTVERYLLLQILVELAFEFAYLAAANACDMYMITGAMALIKVPMTAEMKQVKFVDQAQFLEHFQGAIDRDARDGRINFLGALEDFVRVEVLRSAFDHLKEGTALARETDPAGPKLALQAAERFRDIDTFAG